LAPLQKNHSKNLFTVDTAANIRIIFFTLISFVMMTLDHRHHSLEGMRDMLSTSIFPLQYLIQLPAEAGGWLSEQLMSRSELLAENTRLRQKQLYINAQLQRLTALEVENRRLRMLLESSVKMPERVLIAELLSVDFDPYRHRILLNKGTYHGVYAGQPLLDQQGIIGQVIHAHTFTSTAILITDPNHVLPVQISRNGLRTLAVGTGNLKELELLHISNNEDIQVGDLLITSGLGGRFPSGYPVAKITKVEFDPGRPFAHITAQPTSPLDRSREVLLVINATKPLDGPPSQPALVGPSEPPLFNPSRQP
jgi:rod shape-determining protein MreC